MTINDDQWQSMISMIINDNQWQLMTINDNQWLSMITNDNQWSCSRREKNGLFIWLNLLLSDIANLLMGMVICFSLSSLAHQWFVYQIETFKFQCASKDWISHFIFHYMLWMARSYFNHIQGVFFNWPPPEFAKCWLVSNWFQKNVRVPDWPPLWSENA